MNIKSTLTGTSLKKSSFSGTVFVILSGLLSNTAYATNVTYDFAGNCLGDCGPLGVLDAPVDAVTGTLELNLSEPAIVQLWSATDVLAYSFTFDNFTIDNTNSTLSDSGVGGPYTTTMFSPFSINQGFIMATYNSDNSVALNIGVSGLNLVQGSLLTCTGTCQAVTSGLWLRTSAVPVPAAVWLFGSGLLGLIGVARSKARA